MSEVTLLQREARLTTLSRNNFYYLDIGAPGVRESVIFEGSEISWAQLLGRVTFTHRPVHTFVVMSPVSDLMNNMNDFGWGPDLCSFATESAANAEYCRRGALRNHARFVEEVVATMDPHFSLPPATIVGLVAVFFRDPPLKPETGITCGWGFWRADYLRGRLEATNSLNAQALSRTRRALCRL